MRDAIQLPHTLRTDINFSKECHNKFISNHLSNLKSPIHIYNDTQPVAA